MAAPFDITSIPEWVGASILGASLALLGYVAKLAIELAREVLRDRRARRARLVELLALLHAGDAAFQAQRLVRDRLQQAIVERDPTLASSARSYDELFTAAFPSLPPQERKMFDIVRSYTEHAIRPLNDSLLVWLHADVEFRVARHSNSREECASVRGWQSAGMWASKVAVK